MCTEQATSSPPKQPTGAAPPAGVALHRPLHLAVDWCPRSSLCSLAIKATGNRTRWKMIFMFFPQQLPSTPVPIPFRLNEVMLLTMPNDARRNLVVLTAFTDILMVRLLRFWMKWSSRCITFPSCSSSSVLCPIPNIVTSRRNWIKVFDWQLNSTAHCELLNERCSWINGLAKTRLKLDFPGSLLKKDLAAGHLN